MFILSLSFFNNSSNLSFQCTDYLQFVKAFSSVEFGFDLDLQHLGSVLQSSVQQSFTIDEQRKRASQYLTI